MARKYGPRYFKPQYDYRDTLFNGCVWPVQSSRGGSDYSVELVDRGFSCDCTGFTYHGKCKHVLGISKLVKEALDGRVPQYKWV